MEIMWWNSKALVKNVKISCHSCCGHVLVGTVKAKVVCVVTIVGVLQYETVCVLGGEEGVKAGGNRGYQRAFGERGKHKQQQGRYQDNSKCSIERIFKCILSNFPFGPS